MFGFVHHSRLHLFQSLTGWSLIIIIQGAIFGKKKSNFVIACSRKHEVSKEPKLPVANALNFAPPLGSTGSSWKNVIHSNNWFSYVQ